MKTYKQFLEFVSKNYGSFLFVAVFYSLFLTYKYAISFDPDLLSFPGRMIGEATLNAYDINKRVSSFYFSGFIFLFFLVLLSFIVWRIALFSERFLKSTEARILNFTSLAGIVFCFFNLWSHSFDSSFELIFCIQSVAIAGLVFKRLILKDNPVETLINSSLYSIAFVLGISVFFLFSETSVLFHFLPRPNLLITAFFSVVLIILSAILFIKEKSLSEAKIALNKYAFILIPIACIPILSFFKDEIYLILNRQQIYFFSPRKLYLFFLLGIFLITSWRLIRFNLNDSSRKKNEDLVALRYFPLLVVSLATYTFYNPFVELSNEMFEAGNRFLPLMEFQKYGVLPIFEKFNSHVLSELFFGGIYAFLNGMHSREMIIYDFMYQVFWAFMVYRFMFQISKNAFIALFVILLFPLIDSVLSDYTIISLLAIFLTDKVIRENASFKNYFLLISCLAFLILWRVDIGYPSVVASVATLLVYMINREQFRINWKIVLKSSIVFVSIIVFALFAIAWWRDLNVFEKFWNGLNYLASAQSYGHISMGDTNTTIYKIQYYIFPLIIIFGISVMIVFFKKYTISNAQRFIYSSILFLSVYYLVNFQRGLVRHGFIEGNDNSLSAFIFFIFSGSVFLFFHNKSKVTKLILFLIFSTFLVMNYKFPAPSVFKNIYERTIEKTNSFSVVVPVPHINRCIDTLNFEEEHFSEFEKLISTYLDSNQTFIDFSNMPMLYYITGKLSPSYFYQNPLTIHNDYLQKTFITDIKSYDVPFLVFSNFPENWWDNVDGVPNTLRHFRLAEYFYKQYAPFVIVDNLCVWKRKDFMIENKQNLIFSYYRESDTSKLERKSIIYKIKNVENKQHLIKVRFSDHAPDLKLITSEGEKNIKATFVDEMNHISYYILKHLQMGWSAEFIINEGIRSIQISECEFIPDFYSEYPQKDNCELLPFIWATYDKALVNEKTLIDISSSTITLKQNEIQYYNFTSSIDKTSGNTILVSIETENTEPLFIDLVYGSKKEYKGAFTFKVSPGKGSRNFALRISSQYNWYDPNICYVGFVSASNSKVVLKGLKLLKAE